MCGKGNRRGNRIHPVRGAAIFVLVCLLPCGASGGEVSFDGSLGPQTSLGSGPAYDISEAYGTLDDSSTNLFHSFDRFNLDTGDVATFSGPGSIQNVISRITGGESYVDGTIQSAIQGANMFFINPFGMIFGPSAQLDVSGSFHISTADFLRLADDVIFYADPSETFTLSSAAPVAYGFLSENPASITVQGSMLEVPAGETVSVIGGSLKLEEGPPEEEAAEASDAVAATEEAPPEEEGSAETAETHAASGEEEASGETAETQATSEEETPAVTSEALAALEEEIHSPHIVAESGRIELVSVASPGEVIPNADGQPPGLDVSSFTEMGDIVIEGVIADGGASVTVAGAGNGTVIIRGGSLMIDTASISGRNDGPGDGAEVAVDIDVSGDLLMPSGEIVASGTGAGDAGDIIISAGNMEVGGDPYPDGGTDSWFANIGSRAWGTGDGGNVEVTAENLTIKDSAHISTYTPGAGAGGDVSVEVSGDLQVLNNGMIYTTGYNYWLFDPGNAGDISISAGSILLSGDEGLTGLLSQATGGDSGHIQIDTGELRIDGLAEIETTTWWSGDAGSLDLTADALYISGSDSYAFPAGIFTNTLGSGTGGDLNITAPIIQITDSGSLQSSTVNRGWYGSGTGDGGNINITARSLDLDDGAFIAASGTAGAGGAAGSVTIEAGEIRMTGDPVKQFTGISVANMDGPSGTVQIDTDRMVLDRYALINSTTYGSGTGGTIVINSGVTEIHGGSEILASTAGAGAGGSIEVTGGTLLLSGVSEHPLTDGTGQPFLPPSAIASEAHGELGGDAGSILVDVGRLEIRDSALLTVSTFGTGDAGSVQVAAGEIVVSGVNEAKRASLIDRGWDPDLARPGIFSGSRGLDLGDLATGQGGDISVTAGNILLADEGWLFSGTDTPGSGGDISVRTSGSVTLDGGSISSSSTGTGDAGDISVDAGNRLTARRGSLVTAETEGSGAGGSLRISAGLAQITGGSTLTASTSGSGDGGDISLRTSGSVSLDHGTVASSSSGAGDAGNIGIAAGTGLNAAGSSLITSETRGGGAGGTIRVTAGQAGITGGSTLTARTSGSGDGGDISLRTSGSVTLDHGTVSTSSSGAGDAGNIAVTAGGSITASGGSVITSETQNGGAGGTIDITAGSGSPGAGRSVVPSRTHGAGTGGDIEITGRSVITARTSGSGPGGDIGLRASADVTFSEATVSASSTGTGDAGNIEIAAGHSLFASDSSVTTEALQAGGGKIDITVPYMIRLTDSEITTSVRGGASDAGDITIGHPQYMILNRSRIAANAYEGAGGNIRIFADVFLADATSVVDASSTLGIDGEVTIDALINTADGLIPLTEDFLDAVQLLRKPCMARVTASRYSSLVVGPRGGLPVEPGGLLPSPLPRLVTPAGLPQAGD